MQLTLFTLFSFASMINFGHFICVLKYQIFYFYVSASTWPWLPICKEYLTSTSYFMSGPCSLLSFTYQMKKICYWYMLNL